MLGIWKDYEELENNLSMPELIATLEAKRNKEYNDKKFLAAIQGVDLDKSAGSSSSSEGNPQKAWEDMKARVFSKGSATNSNDVVSLQGVNAEQAGFGIGQGLDYQVVKDQKNPMG